MSRNQRMGLVALAVLVAVAAFLIARPEDDQTEPARRATTQESAPEPAPERPRVARIAIRGGVPQGGVRSIRVKTGEAVRIVVTSDAPDEIHLHGYDITRNAGPGKPARFAFNAKLEGVFEIESHEAEHAGREPRIARLVVEPS
jgi:FtsP/CotA-like multicopper oxidase with cupredoxin domain